MNYDEISDFEINRAVAEQLGYKYIGRTYLYCADGVYDVIVPREWENGDDSLRMQLPDYCNNPPDAWPIIKENRIAISPYCDQGWFADHDSSVIVDDANPLRAAMIVYLMMQETDK